VAAVDAVPEPEPDIAAVVDTHGPETGCSSLQTLQTTRVKGDSPAPGTVVADIPHLLGVLVHSVGRIVVAAELGLAVEAGRLAVLAVERTSSAVEAAAEDMSSAVEPGAEHMSFAVEPGVEDMSSAVEPVAEDMRSVVASGQSCLWAALAGCRQSDGLRAAVARTIQYVEAVQAVVHRSLQYVEAVRPVAHHILQSIVPVQEFAHVQPGAVAHIVIAGWVVSCRMAQVLVEVVDIAILAAAVVVVADSTVAAVAAAKGSFHHHSCTLAEVVCRTGMAVDVTSMLQGEIRSLVVL